MRRTFRIDSANKSKRDVEREIALHLELRAKEFEAIRDFLYTRMRGYHAHSGPAATSGAAIAQSSAGAVSMESADAVKLLEGIHRELRLTRELIESRGAPPKISE